MRRDQVERVPAELGRIGVDAPRHAQQAGEVHRKEGDVEADEHQPERPAAEPLRQRAAAEGRRPVVERGEQRKHHAADQHVVQMRDDEVGVVRLPVERHHRHHHAGQPAEREDEQEAEHEQRRRGESQPARRRGWRSRRTPGCRSAAPPPCSRPRRSRATAPGCRW